MATKNATVSLINGQLVVQPDVIHVLSGQSTIIWTLESSVPAGYHFDSVIAMSSLESFLKYTVESGGRKAEVDWVNNNSAAAVAKVISYTLIISDGATTFRAMAERPAHRHKRTILVDPEISNDPVG